MLRMVYVVYIPTRAHSDAIEMKTLWLLWLLWLLSVSPVLSNIDSGWTMSSGAGSGSGSDSLILASRTSAISINARPAAQIMATPHKVAGGSPLSAHVWLLATCN